MSRAVKGLLIKDFKFMITQMRAFFIIFLVWGVFIGATMDIGYVTGFTAMFASFLALSTLNYDEAENGMPFLLSMPLSRKDYIFEKYVFGFVLMILITVLITVTSIITRSIMSAEISFLRCFTSTLMALLMAFYFWSVEMPIQVKFGSGKSRIITFILMGFMFASIQMLSYLNSLAGVEVTAELSNASELSIEVLMLAAVIILVVLVFVSYKISCRFMEKRNF